MNNGNIPFRPIVILLFTVLLSSCLKEIAVPIESAFSIESSEDKTLLHMVLHQVIMGD